MQNTKLFRRVLFAMPLVAALYFLPDEVLLCTRRIFEALALAHLVIEAQEKN
jgi:hypothetical protein